MDKGREALSDPPRALQPRAALSENASPPFLHRQSTSARLVRQPTINAGCVCRRWIRSIGNKASLLHEAGDPVAEALPLRQDTVAFLLYLKENKVTGTQSAENLPRKAVEAVAARFVTPLALETRIGEAVFRFQNEADVRPVYFVHMLAQAASLASGGPGRRWRLTPTGEQFLALPAVLQVWFLFAGWWFRANWLNAYSNPTRQSTILTAHTWFIPSLKFPHRSSDPIAQALPS